MILFLTQAQIAYIRHHEFFVKNQINGAVPLNKFIHDLMQIEESRREVALKKSMPDVFRNTTQEEISAIKKRSLQTIIQHGLHHKLFDSMQLKDAVHGTDLSPLAETILTQESESQQRLRIVSNS